MGGEARAPQIRDPRSAGAVKRIMVAGGAGFLGSHLCELLLARGHEVVCVDDLSTGDERNLEMFRDDPLFEFVQADVAAAPSLPVDAIAHLASPASPVDYERIPIHTLRANSLGTWRLLDIARERSAALLFVSTSEVYGDPLVHPQPETYWGNVDPIGPRSCYDESKRFGEALLMAYRREHGVRANIVRLFNTYGPRMRPSDGRVIPAMISAALDGTSLPLHGDGLQTRSFCHARDTVAGIAHVLTDPDADGEVLNIGNPAEITMLQLAHAILAAVGGPGEIEHVDKRPGDPERRRPVIERMGVRYGWAPSVALTEGLEDTVRWFAALRKAGLGAPIAVTAGTSASATPS